MARGRDFNEEETALIERANASPASERKAHYRAIAGSTNRTFLSICVYAAKLRRGYVPRHHRQAPTENDQPLPLPRPKLFNNGVYIDDFGITHAELISRLRSEEA